MISYWYVSKPVSMIINQRKVMKYKQYNYVINIMQSSDNPISHGATPP